MRYNQTTGELLCPQCPEERKDDAVIKVNEGQIREAVEKMVNVLHTIKAETDEVLTYLEAYKEGKIVCLSD